MTIAITTPMVSTAPITTAHEHEPVTVEIVHNVLDYPDCFPRMQSVSDRVGLIFASGTDDPEALLCGAGPRQEFSFLLDPDQALALAHTLISAVMSADTCSHVD